MKLKQNILLRDLDSVLKTSSCKRAWAENVTTMNSHENMTQEIEH